LAIKACSNDPGYTSDRGKGSLEGVIGGEKNEKVRPGPRSLWPEVWLGRKVVGKNIPQRGVMNKKGGDNRPKSSETKLNGGIGSNCKMTTKKGRNQGQGGGHVLMEMQVHLRGKNFF